MIGEFHYQVYKFTLLASLCLYLPAQYVSILLYSDLLVDDGGGGGFTNEIVFTFQSLGMGFFLSFFYIDFSFH